VIWYKFKYHWCTFGEQLIITIDLYSDSRCVTRLPRRSSHGVLKNIDTVTSQTICRDILQSVKPVDMEWIKMCEDLLLKWAHSTFPDADIVEFDQVTPYCLWRAKIFAAEQPQRPFVMITDAEPLPVMPDELGGCLDCD
jgi:hypothetical protein